MGWFFAFKLHLICNEKGELLNFMITPGDIDDRKPLEYNAFVEFIHSKLVGDKGHISKNLFQRLFVDGIQPHSVCIKIVYYEYKTNKSSTSRRMLRPTYNQNF